MTCDVTRNSRVCYAIDTAYRRRWRNANYNFYLSELVEKAFQLSETFPERELFLEVRILPDHDFNYISTAINIHANPCPVKRSSGSTWSLSGETHLSDVYDYDDVKIIFMASLTPPHDFFSSHGNPLRNGIFPN